MEVITRLGGSLFWGVSILCLFVSMFIAIEHTTHIFANHNYFFAPFADDILDNSLVAYPISLGEIGFTHIFDPYIDHRVALERIQEIIDFVFTDGVQLLQPYRVSLLLWLNFFIFTWFVIKPFSGLSKSTKVLLSAAYLAFLFPGMSINNYVSTMQITWPSIFLFSLLTFVCLSKYCEVVRMKWSSKWAYLYMGLTVLFLNVVLYTFNIGVVLWPIVYFVLIRQRVFFQYWAVWLGIAVINIYTYLQHDWVMANFHSYTQHTNWIVILRRPLETFYFASRIIGVPFTVNAYSENAFYTFTSTHAVIGLIACFVSLMLIFYFQKKKEWTAAELVFYTYYLFILLALLIIATMRSTSGKTSGVEWRFLTTGLLFTFCLLMAVFVFPIRSANCKKWAHRSIGTAVGIWLIWSFIPRDSIVSGGTYDLGFFNQVFISEAIGIPLNENFLQASKIYQTSGVLQPHVYINTINRLHHKGPYSFWASQQVGRSLNELPFERVAPSQKAQVYVIYDYRPMNSPGLLLNVKLENYRGAIKNDWQVIFVNQDERIIGFAISAPYLRPLKSLLNHHSLPTLLWRGAINTEFSPVNSVVNAWAVNPADHKIYLLGSVITPHTMYGQREPTWVWEHTQHFGA